MWTPRRLLLLPCCFVAFFTMYLGYAHTEVGRIDGLPPLPEEFWPVIGDPAPVSDVKPTPSRLDGRLKEAFGPDCKEQKWPIRLEDHRRNMLIAAEQFQVRDGKVYLTPLSVALYGKKKGNKPVEINTIRCTVAILTFDRPVSSFSEISSRKIAEAELNGRIDIVNNRSRPQRDQDLKVLIPNGPLFYREATHHIWTEAVVTLEDHKTQPPHIIRGQGMEMELITEATEQAKPAGRKPGKETISGVKWVRLNSSVDMELYLEGQDGLMGSGPGGAAKPPPTPVPVADGPPAKKSKLHITTPGRFLYEMNKDHDLATFHVQPVGPVVASRIDKPKIVQAIRTNPDGKKDVLQCHQLTLRLRRKDAGAAKTPSAGHAKPAQPEGGEGQLEGTEIESMSAVADFTRPSSLVVLTADSENSLSAIGRDFYHSAPNGLTILKGQPVIVDQHDNKINAPEIRIQNVTPTAAPGKVPPKPYQNFWATGPGDILLIDKKEGKRTQANWQKLLTSTRDGEQDLLTLTGAAKFIDEAVDQTLRADTIKVWLDLPDAKQASDRTAGISSGRKPRHLEATSNVVARSKDMNIHDTGRLVVHFTDEAPQATLPAVGGAATTPRPGVTPAQPTSGGGISPSRLPTGPAKPAPAPAAPDAGPTTAAGPALGAPAPPVEPRPFDLSARSVEAKILRSPLKSTIDQLYCDGNVIVRQDPAKAEERGTEVKGDTLHMTAGLDGGYFLVVTADKENLAELTTDKIYILGPEVNINQTSNKAWVIGGGAMTMESATNFQGEKLDKPVPLTVHWDKSMIFNGESAEFTGKVTAEQEKSRLACQHMQVNFDKPISLKQGNKTDQPARVSQMLCDNDVRIEERVFTGPRLTKYTRLEGPVVHMTALEPDEDTPLKPSTPGGKTSTGNKVVVSGSGNIRIWEPASGEELPGLTQPLTKPATGGKAAPAKKTSEMKMTYVAFKNRMDANSKTSKASFWGDVRVLNLPCPEHNALINLDTILATDLAEGAIFIRCDRLHVLDRPTQGKSNKQMEGYGRVSVQGRDFDASALAIFYDQLKEQIILEGSDSVPAVLRKETRPGAERSKFEGRKIIYDRKTGKIDGQGVSGASGESQRTR
jgi:lipopolysaccharide export system protein LptA